MFREPSPRGRKGRDRSASRFISFEVEDVRAFDSIGWELMRKRWHENGPGVLLNRGRQPG